MHTLHERPLLLLVALLEQKPDPETRTLDDA